MTQFVIDVHFPQALPKSDALVKILQEVLEQPPRYEGGFDTELVLKFGPQDVAVVALLREERLASVEVGSPPSDFQWLVVASLEHLGGKANQPIPAFVSRRLDKIR